MFVLSLVIEEALRELPPYEPNGEEPLMEVPKAPMPLAPVKGSSVALYTAQSVPLTVAQPPMMPLFIPGAEVMTI